MSGYAQAKLANLLFTRELARRLQGTRVTVNAFHPAASPPASGRVPKLVQPLIGLIMISPARARTPPSGSPPRRS